MEHQITVSNPAFEAMVLAASESFVLGNAEYHGPVEVHGHLWGYRRPVDDEGIEYVHIDKFSVSSSAPSSETSVTIDKRIARIKTSILDLWAPHYYFLGGLHTHPFDTLEELKDAKGWNPSKQDIKVFEKGDYAWGTSGLAPIMAVMAVTEMQAVFDTQLTVESANRWMFNVGNLRFWLSIGVGKTTRSGRRKFSTDDVYLYPQSWYFNQASSKLDGV